MILSPFVFPALGLHFLEILPVKAGTSIQPAGRPCWPACLVGWINAFQNNKCLPHFGWLYTTLVAMLMHCAIQLMLENHLSQSGFSVTNLTSSEMGHKKKWLFQILLHEVNVQDADGVGDSGILQRSRLLSLLWPTWVPSSGKHFWSRGSWSGRVADVIKLFTAVSYDFSCKPLQPSQMFAGKAGAYPKLLHSRVDSWPHPQSLY